MAITLDPALEERIQRQLDNGAYPSATELVARALDLFEAEDWLLRNADAIRADIQECEAEVARGETYTPEEVREFLLARRASRAA